MKKTAFVINFLFMCLFCNVVSAQKTQVKITGIRSAKGNIILNVFKDKDSYGDQRPLKKFTFDKKTLTNGTLAVNFEIEPGTYGVTLLDDENGNGKIDKNIIGIPKEGFGFSNFYMTGFSKPSFDDFKLIINPPQGTIDIKVKYM